MVTTHELVHEVHKNGMSGLVFKIDYEKAYYRVNLDFLYEIMERRGFSPFWIRLIRQVTLVDQ